MKFPGSVQVYATAYTMNSERHNFLGHISSSVRNDEAKKKLKKKITGGGGVKKNLPFWATPTVYTSEYYEAPELEGSGKLFINTLHLFW